MFFFKFSWQFLYHQYQKTTYNRIKNSNWQVGNHHPHSRTWVGTCKHIRQHEGVPRIFIFLQKKATTYGDTWITRLWLNLRPFYYFSLFFFTLIFIYNLLKIFLGFPSSYDVSYSNSNEFPHFLCSCTWQFHLLVTGQNCIIIFSVYD